MDLSVIISTRNRRFGLAKSLAAIERLEADFEWELVLVDNGSTDGTGEALEEFCRRTSLRARVVVEPQPGLANARNRGLREAKGLYFAFTDDDCYPSPDWLMQVKAVFDEDPTIGYVGGRILLFDPTDQRITIQERADRVALERDVFLPAGFIQGANFALRREAVCDTGWFDPFFGPGAHYNAEEVDYLSRVSAAGWKGVYDPRPVVYHHHGRKTVEEVDKLRASYDHGRGAYYAKCLLRRNNTIGVIKNWYWDARRLYIRTILREAVGGVSYLARHLIDRGKRFESLSAPNASPAASAALVNRQ